MNPRLRALIERYLTAVGTAVELLRQVFLATDILKARMSGAIPKTGELGTTSFAFHGVGCEFDFGDFTVDFDFGPDGRHDGFDAWRLWLFARELPEAFPELQERSAVDAALAEAEADGMIVSPAHMPSPHLKYLADDNSVRPGPAGPN